MARRPLEDGEEVEVASRMELRTWLGMNHRRETGIWLVTYKKSDPDRYVSMGEIIRECIAHGWIDSLSRGKDATRTMLWISPRKAGSNWSRINKDIVDELEAEGLMTEAGRRKIEASKIDGTWIALDDVEDLVIPPDLQAAFDALPGAEETWHAFPRSIKRGVLEWILNAKRDETRAKRIAETAGDSADGKRPNQWR
ncbi:YdeI/OmpD-associated family protein [Aestuariibius sp. 2305UL40-4]|uniref:YdeI/OmpD-associated family protein n=1 Tax=Aestuariibius violaceus TaxID=3234132 RepID=UPI00346E077D